MDALSHYHRAEELLAQAMEDDGTPAFAADDRSRAWIHNTLMTGIGHALLALTGVTVLNDGRQGTELEDYDLWHKAVSIMAPIPADSDDDQEDDRDEDPITVGAVSPGRDDDRDALAAWLRAVPPGSMLADPEGDRWSCVIGLSQDGERTFPALLCLSSGYLGNLLRSEIVEHVAMFAPFTVRAVARAPKARE